MSIKTEASVRAAATRRDGRRRRLIAYGQWDPWRPAEPVRAYVLELMAANLPLHRLASGSGVTLAVIHRLLYGHGNLPPSKKLRTENAEAIMAFRPTLDDYPATSIISVIGSRRRLQALATLGWTRLALAERRNITQTRLTSVMERNAKTTSVATARLIRDLYDEVWHREPTADEVLPWVAQRTRDTATRKKWDGPLAWNDDQIDDPKARPSRGRKGDKGVDQAKVMRRLEGEKLELTAWEHTAAIEYGARTRGLTFDAIAELLDMELDSVKRSWERIKERARAAGETWPDARRWTDPTQTAPTASARAA